MPSAIFLLLTYICMQLHTQMAPLCFYTSTNPCNAAASAQHTQGAPLSASLAPPHAASSCDGTAGVRHCKSQAAVSVPASMVQPGCPKCPAKAACRRQVLQHPAAASGNGLEALATVSSGAGLPACACDADTATVATCCSRFQAGHWRRKHCDGIEVCAATATWTLGSAGMEAKSALPPPQPSSTCGRHAASGRSSQAVHLSACLEALAVPVAAATLRWALLGTTGA